MSANQEKIIQIKEEDLPLCCPMLGNDNWDGHPKVFLEVESKETRCPYCSTVYEIIDFDG
jgi:uncharacterized Zn-finger protein